MRKRHLGYCREFQITKYAPVFLMCQKLIFEIVAIRVVLRGKAHAEWKVMLSGDRRTVKGDQYFLDQRQTIWGEKNLNSTIPILPRGVHKFPFK